MKVGYAIVDRLSIPSSFDEVHKVEQLIDRTCASLGVNEENYGNVLIAVTEAVNNAIQHGNKLSDSLTVELSVSDSSESFCFAVEDQGNGFDFNNLPDPTSPENILKEHGRGIFLMRSLSDEVCFENNGKKVLIFFTK
jgi:serine/threonine-protein kinase RsbW